ncbi:MAG: DNA gyrase inhibitor YacG [Burkholderiales bacterium]|nr:DNA gyrase inhibitor YacG [Burkholderiales bacterium]
MEVAKPRQRLVACPQCGRTIIWSKDNSFRPFCSERCKLIDLGAWASERYRIAAESNVEDVDNEIGKPDEDR